LPPSALKKNADYALVAALAGGSSVREAAEQARVAERTVYRRLEDPDFKTQVSAARSELLAGAVGHLADYSTEAATTLRGLLGGRVRIRPARGRPVHPRAGREGYLIAEDR
jgi:hypothetical protein